MKPNLAIPESRARSLPIGAECGAAGVHFRVWAPDCRNVEVCFRDAPELSTRLTPYSDGYFSGLVTEASAGMLYGFRLDNSLLEDGSDLLPDPASRFQPEGPRGPSQIVDPRRYAWHDSNWPGIPTTGQVLYEMHVGAFTPAGTWQSAAAELVHLAELGVTAIELLPIAEFPGQFGWGYDGANLFAPSRLYGPPEDLRSFVDEAHRVGLGVILDVVYNHMGTVGDSLLRKFSEQYFGPKGTDWGAAFNFDGPGSAAVREFILANIAYWIQEYHLDGYRIDATQSFVDRSPQSILAELCPVARRAAGRRTLFMIGENEPQEARLLRSADQGGYEFDALWNEDFHHLAMVRLTGKAEAYYSDYQGSAEEFVAAAKWGYLFQGQRYAWQDKRRGTPALDIAAPRFINYLQNHDQLANTLDGSRVDRLTSPGRLRAMTALHLLLPQTPLLFQGQEFSASSPFFYFNDCDPGDEAAMRDGRRQFMSQFRSLNSPEILDQLPDPADEQTFLQSKLNHEERTTHASTWNLHRDLLTLRRSDPVFSLHDSAYLHGAVLCPEAFALRFLSPGQETRLLVVNFGRERHFLSIANPLLAPPAGGQWKMLWSSEDHKYGGHATAELETPDGWHLPGEAAVVLTPSVREVTS